MLTAIHHPNNDVHQNIGHLHQNDVYFCAHLKYICKTQLLKCKKEMRQLKITNSITNRDSLSLDKYLAEISKYELISAEEEVELAQRIQVGDEEAKQKLTRANLRFVISVAKQYQNQGISLPDLINEGNCGLVKAAEKFDHTKGFKFISYAVWWIRQSILMAINEKSRMVRIPSNKVLSLAKYKKVAADLEQKHHRTATDSEIAEKIEMDVTELSSVRAISEKHVSFDAPVVDDENGRTLQEVVVDKGAEETDKKLINESLRDEIDRAFSFLTDREAEILKKYFGIREEERSIEYLSEYFNLTRERIRQIKDIALRKLRYSSKSSLLKAFLG